MTRTYDRRTLLAAGGAAVLMPSAAHATTAGTRTFTVTRDGSEIGTHRVSVSRDGDMVRARTDIDIAVSVLGFTAYRYALNYDEVYQGGLLQSLSATANDDGDQGFARASRSGDMLQVEGSKFSGMAPGQAVPTSYWRMGGVGVTPWISAQTGDLLAVAVSEGGGSEKAPPGSRVLKVSDNAEYDVELWYDAAGDWVGCAFDAGGELGIYTLQPGSDSLVALAT